MADTEVLLALHNIEDRLGEIVQILKAQSHEAVEANKRKLLEGSALRKRIYGLCDGNRSVSQLAKIVKKSLQQTSNNVTLLENAGLIKVAKRGKEKYYIRAG
jgi:DNA-binding transcriptional ArsR family regulator